MKSEDGISSKKILLRILVIIIVMTVLLVAGVFATKNDLNYITIQFPDDTQISVVTAKTVVREILEENNIVLLEDEQVVPSIDSVINAARTIEISKISKKPIVVAEEETNVTTEQILGNYVTVRETVVVEQEEIPFETITKDVSQAGSETVDKVLQQGENGLKEIKYKVRYENDVEVSRTVIEETILKEPVDKIIQISTRIISRSSNYRVSSAISLAATVEGITPTVTTLRATAYAPDNQWGDMTACGAHAQSWYTVASDPSIPFGTVMYIPYFASQPNGGWFVVQDRGGAIKGARLDVFMDTESECRAFGVRNLEVYIYY